MGVSWAIRGLLENNKSAGKMNEYFILGGFYN
jgi:hypothetical protein